MSANAQSIPMIGFRTKEVSRRPFRSPPPLSRKDRNRALAAQDSRRILDGVSAASLAPYVTPQELSALRNDEDGGCVAKIRNLLEALDEKRARQLVESLNTAHRMKYIMRSDDPFRDVVASLRAEEKADAADCTPQQEFLLDPTKQNARVLREALQNHVAEANKAIDMLVQFEESADE